MATDQTMFRKYIANSLKEFRHTYKLTQEEMSECLGISLRSYTDIEHGRYGVSAHTLTMFMSVMSNAEALRLIDELREIVVAEERESA